ncbi:MAG TPA: RNA polymerase sigma factor [Ilumatobacter sp.]
MVSSRDLRSDGELLAAVHDRDRGALNELYRRHESWLTVRLAYRCNDRGAVEEAVQDTFVKVWNLAGRYDGSGEVAAWIWGIGIRTLLHRMRPRKSLLDRLSSLRPTHAPIDVTSAEDQVLIAVQHGDVGGALGSLSPELRAVVQATVLDGLTCEEAARMLDIPTGTVKTRMMRAKRELREALL